MVTTKSKQKKKKKKIRFFYPMKKFQVLISSIHQPVFSFSLLLYVCIRKKKNLSCHHRAHIEEEKKKKREKEKERERDSLTEEASDGGKSEFHLHSKLARVPAAILSSY
jgi:hypothetical protein